MAVRKKVLERLDKTGIRREEETVVPINGATVDLPYMVVRTEENDQWDDMGRVCISTITWTVVLFTTNKDFALECKIRKVLAGLNVEVERFPDGEPYSVYFTFTTKGVKT